MTGRVARPPALGRDGCGPAQSAQNAKGSVDSIMPSRRSTMFDGVRTANSIPASASRFSAFATATTPAAPMNFS